MSDGLPKVTFIIPAKNEEAMLPSTLDSIHLVVGDHFEYEIIVVDNGSNDCTVTVAKTKGAKVIVQETGTIGSLRNTAAKKAKGKYLVFIDADVSITLEWLKPFLGVVSLMKTNVNIITGSRCSTDENAGWIAKSWFRAVPTVHQTTHVGTGHMITSKRLFESLGGFDEKLQTGEDYEFCIRAKREGALIIKNHKLKVIHHGVPRTLSEFIRREIWHGAGDVRTVSAMVNSKVVMLSLVFFVAHIGLISGIIFSARSELLIVTCILTVLVIVVTSAWKKYHYTSTLVILRNIVLYYFYFWARFISIINRILPIISFRQPRAGRPR